MIRLSNWILLKVIFKSIFANYCLYGSSCVDKKSGMLSKDSVSFRSGGKFYIVELTVMKDLE